MNDFTSTIALGSLTATLAGCLVWTIKHFVSRTIPDLQQAHTLQIDRLCATFRDEVTANRDLAYKLHAENLTALERLTEAVAENQVSLIALLERTSPNGQYPRPWRPPMSENVDGGDDAA